MTHHKLIFWDFDGVIVSTFDDALYSIQHLIPEMTADQYRQRFDGNIYETIKSDDITIKGDYMSHFIPRIMQRGIVPGIPELIRRLGEHHTQVIVSSTPTEAISSYLGQYDLDQYFDSVWGSDKGTKKSDKIQRALNQYDTAPHTTVLITDTLGDMREAAAVGVPTIGVTWGYQYRDTLQQGDPLDIADSVSVLSEAIDQFFSS